MTVPSTRLGGLLALLVLATACETSKSANPLSPSVAGPLPGVEISAPKPLEPGVNWDVSNDKQPLKLLIENPSTTGARPVTLEIEVASDEGFSTKVFSKAGVTPGENGRTEVQLPAKLTSDRTYFWRVKGQDGANHGPWSTPVRFAIYTPAQLQAPTPRSPIGGAKVDDLDPSFRFKNAGRAGPVGNITYILDISRNDSFSQNIATYTGGEENGASGETTIEAISRLPADSTLFWRVRAWDGSINGPWSTTQHFKTGSAPALPPGGGGGGGGGNPGNCASNNGDYIVNCIAQKYPSYRRAGVSSSQRRSNMEFLRNRIIEAGICGGLNLGWNLKRGGPEISIDFIAEERGGQTYGYDIAVDYDNTSTELRLYWGADGPGSKMKDYSPRPSCN
jgi:hypothetical protein